MKIEFPQTAEYGYILTESNRRVYTPSIKSFWKRLELIVDTIGGQLHKETGGFQITGLQLTKEHRNLINQEVSAVGMKTISEDVEIKIGEEGREEPNFDVDEF